MGRTRLVKVLAVALAGLLVVGAAVLVHNIFFGPKTISAVVHHRHRYLSG